MKKSLGAKTLVFPTPVWIVGTYDKDGWPNGMTAAWGGICCSKPPCVYVALQKPRYSYANIVERQAYTLNVPSRRNLSVRRITSGWSAVERPTNLPLRV